MSETETKPGRREDDGPSEPREIRPDDEPETEAGNDDDDESPEE